MLNYVFVRSFAVSFILLLSRVVYGTFASVSVFGAYNLIKLSVIRSFAICDTILCTVFIIKSLLLLFFSLQLQNTDSITYQLDLCREMSENPLNESHRIPICMAFSFYAVSSCFDIKTF